MAHAAAAHRSAWRRVSAQLLCQAAALLVTAHAAAQSQGLAPGLGGPHAWLVPASEMPLHTEGRYIVGRGGQRVKWACVNWYGAYSETVVVGGLELQPLDQLADRIVELGFNCVRLCYSTQAQLENPVVKKKDVLQNPQFWGKRFMDVWDATVRALTDRSLMVIINNQVHKSGWCCHWSQDEGLWYVPGYPESVWIQSLVNMTLRHHANPHVVAFDLRNEVHDYKNVSLTWGDGDPETDWAAAATRAGNAVLAANPNVLIVVMALCFGMELRGVRDHPVRLDVPHRVVYQTHNYLEYQLWGLISQGFASWRVIRLSAGISAALVTVALCVLAVMWMQQGKPRPRVMLMVITSASWILVLSLLGIGVCEAALLLLAQAPACGFWARLDVIPVRNSLLGLAVACFLLAILCCLCRNSLERLWERRGKCTAAPAEGSGELGTGESSADDSDDRAPVAGDCERRVDDVEVKTFGPRNPLGSLSVPLLGGDRDGEEDEICTNHEDKDSDASEAFAQPGLQRCGCVRCGLCCWLQCFVFLVLLLALSLTIFVFGFLAPSYSLLRTHLHNQWGFVLEEGHEYTAPVWMGEFGNSARGHYWNNLMHYLNEYDIDFAYWAINGLKWTTGHISITSGQWIAEDPHWSNETYGLLKADYWTVRSAWRLLDLQSLMPSPARWRPLVPACDRQVLGNECGD